MRAIILVFATVIMALLPARSGAECKGDFNGDTKVTVDEILVSVSNALNDCPAGARYVDNGDGTITDTRTGVMWEKKSGDGGIHDRDQTYTWGDASSEFIAGLNAGAGFAGHNDWRLPSVTELQSLIDYGSWAPAVAPAFNAACDSNPNCTVVACSCITPDYYWSSTPLAEIPDNAWVVDFGYGLQSVYDKAVPYYVRAARGGL